MTHEAIPVVLGPGGFDHVRQVSRERPGELHDLALQVGGWAMGKCLVLNKNLTTETRHTFQNSRMTERCEGLKRNGARRGEVR